MKRVVSVSLGSSKRDSSSRVNILGVEFEISRLGTDGDMDRFAEMVRKLDGAVDAIGLGGIDRYLWTDRKRYTVRDADRLARNAKVTPVVDGSGVKHTLERKAIYYLQENGIVDFSEKRVMVVSAVDRFGMAQTIDKLAGRVIYGDLIFALGIQVPMRSYQTVRLAAALFLPIIAKMPFKWLYPTGKKQENIEPKYQKYYKWADIIAGDYHLIRRTMPTVDSGLLRDKILITNTLTADDIGLLKDRGVAMVVTATPLYDGRYYSTNVLEGMLVAFLNKRLNEVKPEDYEALLERMQWRPTITYLQTEN